MALHLLTDRDIRVTSSSGYACFEWSPAPSASSARASSRSSGRRRGSGPAECQREAGERGGPARPLARRPRRAPLHVAEPGRRDRDRRGGGRPPVRDGVHGRRRRHVRRVGEPDPRERRAARGAPAALRSAGARDGERRRGGSGRDAAQACPGSRALPARRHRRRPPPGSPHLRRPPHAVRRRRRRRRGGERLLLDPRTALGHPAPEARARRARLRPRRGPPLRSSLPARAAPGVLRDCERRPPGVAARRPRRADWPPDRARRAPLRGPVHDGRREHGPLLRPRASARSRSPNAPRA